MNRKEFNKIMKVFNFKDKVSTTLGGYGYLEDLYLLKDCATYYLNNEAVIMGMIPLSLAVSIWEQTANDSIYSIKVNGESSCSINPKVLAVDSIYENEINKLIKSNLDAQEYLDKCKIATDRLDEREDSLKYIKSYHIGTKEDFILVLSIMKNHYEKNNTNISNPVVFQKK